MATPDMFRAHVCACMCVCVFTGFAAQIGTSTMY